MLEKMKLPDGLASLSVDKLTEICGEIREILIKTISDNGGHLASNLGIVELTVALHHAFSSPKDKIIFDVGHQAYVHKLLTGRLDSFSTLRTYGGISGFPDPEESEHDVFKTGHSSASVSSALGISVAADLDGRDDFTVAVIGDGSLTGGLAYEGLNNAGKSGKKFIVILNDNEMSISPNVGAVQSYLSKLRIKPSYFSFKKGFKRFVSGIPFCGKFLFEKLAAMKMVLKDYFFRSTLFEQMGFYYIGPVDGHNIKQLCDVMTYAKEIDSPVLIHVRTVKGKGYAPAENAPGKFHGVAPFNAETGEVKGESKKSFSNVFGDTVCELAKEDERICAITAAMADGTKLDKFKESFPNRFFDTGIAEEHAVTFAAGLAKGGKIPVFAVYSTFLQRAYDEILHDVSLQQQKVVFAVDRAGLVGADGATHHGMNDVQFLTAMPKMTVFAPANGDELKEMLKKACFEVEGAVAVRYPKDDPDSYKGRYTGNAFDIYRMSSQGAKTLVITYGREISCVFSAVKELYKKQVVCDVMKLNVIAPLDAQSVCEALSKYDEVFFFEEAARVGSVAERLGAAIAEQGIKCRYHIRAVDGFVPHGDTKTLLKLCGLDEQSIEDAILHK